MGRVGEEDKGEKEENKLGREGGRERKFSFEVNWFFL